MLARRKMRMVIIMAFFVAVIGCQSEEETPLEQTTRPEVMPQSETTARLEETPDSKAAFQETIQNQLAELDKGIETLRAKAGEVSAESKEELNQMIQSLQSQKEVVEERLEAMKGEASGGWETLKSSTEEAMKNLKNTYESVANRFL